MLALLIILSVMAVELLIMTERKLNCESIVFGINFLLVLALLALHVYEC